MEKSAVLDVGKNLRSKLATTYPDKKIIMSRTGDTYPTLDERVQMANRVKLGPNETILFVSIHANASLKPQANGFEVWYLPQEYRRTVVDSSSIESSNKNLLLLFLVQILITSAVAVLIKVLSDLVYKIAR